MGINGRCDGEVQRTTLRSHIAVCPQRVDAVEKFVGRFGSQRPRLPTSEWRVIQVQSGDYENSWFLGP